MCEIKGSSRRKLEPCKKWKKMWSWIQQSFLKENAKCSHDSGSNYCCNPVACKLVLRYRQILPNPTVEKKSLEGGGSSSEESHILSNVGSQNPKVGAWLCFYLFYKPKEARQILINVRLMFNCQNDANIDFSSLLFYNFGNFQTKRLFIDIFPP